LALLHKFVYEFRENNTYIILDRTALSRPSPLVEKKGPAIKSKGLQNLFSFILK
jgi:hypothetical protein